MVQGGDFLYKRYMFSEQAQIVAFIGKTRRGQTFLPPLLSSRYFIADDGQEYRWKITEGVACLLMRQSTGEELARYVHASPKEALFASEKRPALRIHPACNIDIELGILTFVLMEKKRRDRMGDGTSACAHDEDPQGDGGGAEGGGG